MIKQIKFTIKNTLLILSLATFITACNKDEFYELEDRMALDEAIWDLEGAVQLHLNRTYEVCVPTFPFQIVANDRNDIHIVSDESILPETSQWGRNALGMGAELGNNDVRWTGNRYVYTPGDNKYFDIQRCNEAIFNIPLGTMPQAAKDRFIGQYSLLRAMTYFELVKVYGGVPLPLEPQSPERLYTEGRQSARKCFDAIVADLDRAASLLEGFTPNDATQRGMMTTLIAKCLKAKVLLYWASPQFNPLNDPKHPYDQTRWDRALAANKEAYEYATTTGQRSLQTKYEDIFRLEGTLNTEAILVRSHAANIERRGHDTETRSRPASENGSTASGFIPTIKMMEAYPMKDGNPPGASAYTYDALLFWKDRDPRFAATFAWNGSDWMLSNVAGRKQWTYNTAVNRDNIAETNGIGVYVKRFTKPDLARDAVRYSTMGGNGYDWIELRLAEVMLNYADCLNEASLGNETEAKNMVRMIRRRAGIEAGNNDYGIGNITGKLAVRELILKERMIEFAFENKRNADLRRTRTMHLLSGNMQKLVVELVNTSQKAVLEAKTNNVMFRETLNLNDKTVYQTYFKHTVNTPNFPPYAFQQFHYFYTFHNDFVNNGVNIIPTIGWAGGAFDPLD